MSRVEQYVKVHSESSTIFSKVDQVEIIFMLAMKAAPISPQLQSQMTGKIA